MNEQIIIVCTEHPVLGPLLIPYLAIPAGADVLRTTEQAFHASEATIDRMSEAERALIRIAASYTEKNLMSVYSREKVVATFLRKLSEDPERLKNVVRPFIEKKLLEMLTLVREHSLPVYQKQPRSPLLYDYHAYRIYPHDTEIHFSFTADDRHFSYQLQCYYDGEPFSLREKKPVVVLTTSPATLMLGMELRFFAHIESNRLLPFVKKESISTDIAQLDRYIDNIVIPIARYHEIETHGLEIAEEQRTCEPLLSIEETVMDQQELRLEFRYGDRTFVPGRLTRMRRVVYKDADGQVRFFQRDAVGEEQALALLLESGLRRVSDVLFRLSAEAPEKSLSEWIANHREMLQDTFSLSGKMGKAPYCLDEIRVEQSYDDTPDWFELRITVAIGDLRIPFSRFRKHILEGRREFLLPDGRMILLPEEWFCKYADLLEAGTPTEKGLRLKHVFVGAVQSALEGEEGQRHLPTNEERLNRPVPPEIKATLRPYQQRGYSWMALLCEQGLGGCLADDMGLGKTLQTLTLLQSAYPADLEEADGGMEPADHIAPPPTGGVEDDGQLSLFFSDTPSAPAKQRQPKKPASLVVVPTSLLHNWRLETRRFTHLVAGEYSSGTSLNLLHPERFFGRYQVVFTSYGMMRNNIEALSTYPFEYIVLDESQNIKNSDSLTFRAAIRLQGRHKLVLTGTPIENSLKDLWAQFRFIQPDLLGTEAEFQQKFITPIRQGNLRMEKRLRQLTAPFILRRSKREVAPELPPLTEERVYCEMSEAQQAIYKQEKNSLRNALLDKPAAGDRRPTLNILNGLLRLRQLACHPRLIDPTFIGASGKMEQIIETFDTLRSEGHKVLIFSSFVKHLELLADTFRQRGWKYALLTGATDDRPAEIAHFTEQEDVQAFLISLKAGGVGLNLTQADYVFIIDPWWNPAAEAQAIARAHRIGQEKQVIAYRFITQGSIEEKILHLQAEKKRLVETFVTDTDALSALTDEEWAELLE
ncbi:MAG: DEAD/DEAH box helicase [Mediterranea sp.]|jgi:superfamily II DNA or RNA helicase|nr:DEAD/DEAH box helicase [Mediterranea sp.]